MNRLHLFILLCVVFAGCCTDNLVTVTSTENNLSLENYSFKRNGAEGCYYHPGINLVLEAVTSSSYNNVYSPSDSRGTHYGIKFFPKNYEELARVNETEGVQVSYIPFGYRPAPHKMQEINKMNPFPVFEERNNHIYQYQGQMSLDSKDGRSVFSDDSFDVTLPVLYAIWPKDIPIPDPVDYQICFSIRFVNKEVQTKAESWPYHVYNAEFYTSDSFLNGILSLPNLKVLISNGLLSSAEYTNSQGVANIIPFYLGCSDDEAADLDITVVLETPKWMIAQNNNTTPIHIYLGKLGDLWSTPNTTHYFYLSSPSKEIEVHRAVDYYFNENHVLSSGINSSEQGTIFYVFTQSANPNPSYPAMTTFPLGYIHPYVVVNSAEYSTPNDCIGSVLHELGHIRHYYNGVYDSSNNYLKESYASFVGWRLGEDYYLSKGYVKPSEGSYVNWQSRQSWIPLFDNIYTPFFIDLQDDYNQVVLGCLDDSLSSVPVSVIEDLMQNCTSISGCISRFNLLYSGQYFSDSVFNQYSINYTGL